MLNEWSKRRETEYYTIQLILNVHKRPIYRDIKGISGCVGQKVGLGWTESGHDGSYWGEENILQLIYGDVIPLGKFIKNS